MLTTEDAARLALANTVFEPYWLDTLPPANTLAALSEDLSVDLLVVGGGFCGLWGAILAKQKYPEKSVVLIEAKSIANGASGRPAAILSTSVMHGIDNTERTFPEDVAELEELGKLNIDAFRQTIERYHIKCDLEWGGELKVSVGDDGIDAIAEDHRLYQKYGHDSVELDKDDVQSEINSPIFHAGSCWRLVSAAQRNRASGQAYSRFESSGADIGCIYLRKHTASVQYQERQCGGCKNT